MEISDKELWEKMDEAVYGTSDPAQLKVVVNNQLAEWERLESSLGGFLYLLRESRGLTVPKIAAQVGVSEETWEMWEGDVSVPGSKQVDGLVKRLGLWKTRVDQFMKLWHQSSFQSLRRLLQFRPELLAARGVGGVTADSQWSLLHPEAKKRLSEWALKRGFSLPSELFEMLDSFSFENEEEETEWARKVWHGNE